MRALTAMFCLISLPVLAEKALEQARAQVQALQFAAAAKSLDEARGATNLSRDEVLALFELSGIVAGSRGDAARAREAFMMLATLDPGAKLKGRAAPKVQTPFLEGKALAREQGALEVSLGAVTEENGRVTGLELRCPRALTMVKTLQVTIEEDGTSRVEALAWAASVVVPVAAKATVVVRVRVLSVAGWELGTFGPFTVRATPPVATTTSPAPTQPPLVEHSAPPTSTGLARPVGWVLAGVGVAGLITGAVFGVRSAMLRSSLDTVEVRDSFAVGLTRTDALQRSQDTVTSAVVANVCFIAGGALVASGVVAWLLGLEPPSPSALLVPTPGGIVGAFSGAF